MSVTSLWWALATVTLAGAVATIVSREMSRMLLGLGAFLLGMTGLYASAGFHLMAVAELFVYVGGVLVLFLFAIASIGRDTEGRSVERRLDARAALASAAVAGTLAFALFGSLPNGTAGAVPVEATAAALLGGLLPHFEMVGTLLLVALAAALAVIAGGDER